jgi:hypothetical protein
VIDSIAPHPVRLALYALWVASLVWFALAIARPGRAGEG